MKQIEIMYNNCILSDYGKIICNGNEYDIDYFIKKIGNPNKIDFFTYSNETKSFTYRQKGGIISCYLKLSNKYQEELENGIINHEIQKLMELARKMDLYNLGKELNESINNTGALPSSKNELIALKSYLDREIKRTNATIAINGIALTFPIILGTISCFFLMNAFHIDLSSNDIHTINAPQRIMCASSAFLFSAASSVARKIVYEGERLEQPCFTSVKEALHDNMILYRRRKEVIKKLKPLLLETKEDEYQTYNSSFLNLYKQTRLIVEKLPSNEKEKYSLKLESLMNDYIKNLDIIINENGHSKKTGEYSDVYKLNEKFLKEIIIIFFDVCSIINDLKRISELKSNCQKELLLTQDLAKKDEQIENYNSYSIGYEESNGSTSAAYMPAPEQRKI